MSAIPIWKIAGASVPGFDHIDAGVPCDDAHAIVTTPSGWLVATVCDGAGSAQKSATGSRRFAGAVANDIARQVCRIDVCGPVELYAEQILSWLRCSIVQTRSALLNENEASTLRDFHSTLVGVIAGPAGGVFFHVGDGVGCAARSDFSDDAIVSEPENGEFANETFFVTEHDWEDHLRLVFFGPEYDLVVLMSDGVSPFAMTSGNKSLFSPFIQPLSTYLQQHTRQRGEAAIRSILAQDRVRAITGDDKTIVWALRLDQRD